MLIEIQELELHPIEFEEEYRPGVLDLGPDLQQRTPLHAAGRAQLIEEHHGKHQRRGVVGSDDVRMDCLPQHL